MRSYNKNKIYICCIRDYLKYTNRRFDLKHGFIYNNSYFSTFLKINENSFIDLLTAEYYHSEKNPDINVVLKLNLKSKNNNISEKEIFKEANKFYSLIKRNYLNDKKTTF